MPKNRANLRLVHDEDVPEKPRRGRARRSDRSRRPGVHRPDLGGMPQEMKGVPLLRKFMPKTLGQARLGQAIDENDMIAALGPAGCGKTHVAVAKAVAARRAGKVKRIILSRPAVEAGERLGFLPGDMGAKMDPYMRPLYDELGLWMTPAEIAAGLEDHSIEIVPLAFMRGRTLRDSFIVLDEGQNATVSQLRMALTRLGENSTIVVTGDPYAQSDLPEGRSGLAAVAAALDAGADRIAVVRLDEADIVRHPTVRAVIPLLAALA